MSVKDIDSHKLNYHPAHVAAWKHVNFCYPIHIEAGITNSCNHRCIQCTLDWINHKNDFIDTDHFLRTLREAADIGVKSIYFAGEGEPTLHPDLAEFVEAAHGFGMKTALSTNGSELDPALIDSILPHLSWIRFSLDAATKETFKKIHRVSEGQFDLILSNISRCVEKKKKDNLGVQIGIQTLLMPENINEIEALAWFGKCIGVDNVQVKPAHSHPKSSYQIGIYKYMHDEFQRRLERLTNDVFTVVIRVQSMERLQQPRNYLECHAFNFYCLIDAHGDVIPCNVFYGDKDFIFGNIKASSLKDIWESERKRNIIDSITELKHRQCKEYRCRQDVMNRYLERIKNPEVNDEFI